MRDAKTMWAGVLLGAAGACAAQTAGSEAAAVQWLSEAFPPFSFVGPSGPQGIAVDLMKAAQAQAGLPEVAPAFMPWARVLQILGEPGPACVTAMARTPAREAHYRWVGPFLPVDFVVARKTPAPPWPAGDKPLAGRNVVVVRGDVSEDMARNLGADEVHLHRVSDPEIAARMLLAGRVDGWVYGEAVLRWTLATVGASPDQYRVDGRVKTTDSYFACSLGVGAEYLKRLQQGLDALKVAPKGGISEYDRIVARYLKSQPVPPK